MIPQKTEGIPESRGSMREGGVGLRENRGPRGKQIARGLDFLPGGISVFYSGKETRDRGCLLTGITSREHNNNVGWGVVAKARSIEIAQREIRVWLSTSRKEGALHFRKHLGGRKGVDVRNTGRSDH